MATAARLLERLRQVLAADADTPMTKEALRECISVNRVAGAICARDPEVDGKIQTFSSYFGLIYGEPVDVKVKK